jgi:hypothetical protein
MMRVDYGSRRASRQPAVKVSIRSLSRAVESRRIGSTACTGWFQNAEQVFFEIDIG